MFRADSEQYQETINVGELSERIAKLPEKMIALSRMGAKIREVAAFVVLFRSGRTETILYTSNEPARVSEAENVHAQYQLNIGRFSATEKLLIERVYHFHVHPDPIEVQQMIGGKLISIPINPVDIKFYRRIKAEIGDTPFTGVVVPASSNAAGIVFVIKF